ncbi:polysaccharide deacetylase family protein [Sphingomicrobium arenosum]|uniref:polysaccharide deacetylase family protein n=1 Tax=Sphingomicrobium arenosum TaxID=2233861 RepID=UPI00223F5372|nr:polysaccharide deacetylase family protein [Sphingomicrobium arenosum]
MPATKGQRRLLGVLLLILCLWGSAMGLLHLVKARCFAVTGPLVCRGSGELRQVALTFDDGPSARGVDHVLPILEEKGVKATFFLEGKEVAAKPELVRRIDAAGHEIGNHSWSHSHLADLTRGRAQRELERTDRALAEAGVAKPRWMRPPYGVKFTGLGRAVAANEQVMVMWDVIEPGGATSPRDFADRLLADVRPGSIILIHPMARSRDLERAALPLVIEGLQAAGYDIVTVGDLLGER